MYWLVSVLFAPAGMGLLLRVMVAPTWDERWIALTSLLLCLEQGRMAAVDLYRVTQTQAQTPDPQLDRFYWVTLSTIGVELVGFYGTLRWLGWGAMIVLASQVWFHLLAKIELQPDHNPPFYPRGIAQRRAVIAADILALGLVGLWIAQVGTAIAAALLFSILLLYGLGKYGLPLFQPQPIDDTP